MNRMRDDTLPFLMEELDDIDNWILVCKAKLFVFKNSITDLFPRRRDFKKPRVFYFSPPIVKGCRRAINIIPHPKRRTEDFEIRPAMVMNFVDAVTRPTIVLSASLLSVLTVIAGGASYIAIGMVIGLVAGTALLVWQWIRDSR